MCIRDRAEVGLPHVLNEEGTAVGFDKFLVCSVATKVEQVGSINPVSYTHLDVYKRQARYLNARIGGQVIDKAGVQYVAADLIRVAGEHSFHNVGGLSLIHIWLPAR